MTDTTNPIRSPLPARPDGLNADRAGWAAAAIAAFRRATGADPDDALTDLLADLMHWGDRSGHDFDRALERARAHYQAETAGETTWAGGSPSAQALLAALDDLLAQTVDQDLKHGIALAEGETDAREQALAAIARANP